MIYPWSRFLHSILSKEAPFRLLDCPNIAAFASFLFPLRKKASPDSNSVVGTPQFAGLVSRITLKISRYRSASSVPVSLVGPKCRYGLSDNVLVNICLRSIESRKPKNLIFDRIEKRHARDCLEVNYNFRWCTQENCGAGQIHELRCNSLYPTSINSKLGKKYVASCVSSSLASIVRKCGLKTTIPSSACRY